MPINDDAGTASLRPAKYRLDPWKPYHYLQEQEPGPDGIIEKVNTLFLANRECPFKCIMCDLWKHTLDEPTPAGAIPAQIRHAHEMLPEAPVAKLYNNGNFFDRTAVPPSDYPEIVSLLKPYRHVIVENHPGLVNEYVTRFQQMLEGSLEIAMGLETVHPEVLPALNKKMTTRLFSEAAGTLHRNGIRVRAFVLLNPPFLTDPDENITWCLKSVAFAFENGVDCCSIIPVRTGNGAMDKLEQEGHYRAPTLGALEEVFKQALAMKAGRVFADLWDLEKFSDCGECLERRIKRLREMNLKQMILPEVSCRCNNTVN